jgi:hypothetical protein
MVLPSRKELAEVVGIVLFDILMRHQFLPQCRSSLAQVVLAVPRTAAQ